MYAHLSVHPSVLRRFEIVFVWNSLRNPNRFHWENCCALLVFASGRLDQSLPRNKWQSLITHSVFLLYSVFRGREGIPPYPTRHDYSLFKLLSLLAQHDVTARLSFSLFSHTTITIFARTFQRRSRSQTH